MAGTSGCIPDYHVNFFGQLCKPARRPSPSTMSSPNPKPEPQTNIENQTNTASQSPRTPEDLPAPRHRDPLAEFIWQNQVLVRGLSCGDIETYQATLRAVFKKVRESRRKSCAERAGGREVGDEGGEVDEDDGIQTSSEDRDRITNGNQSQTQQTDEGAEGKNQYKEQEQPHPQSHYAEHAIQTKTQNKSQNKPEPQPRPKSSPQFLNKRFITTHYPQHKDQIGLIIENQGLPE